MQTTHSTYDVIVFGGGTAGVPAAIQSARAGARTLLVEKSALLGGTITQAGVNYPSLFHAWGHQIIAGIGWELVLRTVREVGGNLPDFRRPYTHQSEHAVLVAPAVFAAICDESVLDAGVELLLHSMPAALRVEDEGWQVTICTKAGLETVHANVVIDCTGDANAVALAGGELVFPEVFQPATLVCRASGYDPQTLDIAAINCAYQEWVEEGLLEYTDAGWKVDQANPGHWLFSRGSNANHIAGLRAHDSRSKTDLELAGRRSFLRLYRFLKTQPGLKDLHIEFLAGETGVRESVVIGGKKTITEADYVSGRQWEDGLCYAFYPIDLHTMTGSGLDLRPLVEGVVPSVPRGALLPRGTRNLIAAGRCVSSDRAANSGLRVQAACMAMGQVAGALAVLSVQTRVEVESLPIGQIRALLRQHGAIVPE